MRFNFWREAMRLELLIVAISAFSISVIAQTQFLKVTKEEWEELRIRAARIEEELKQPGNPSWAGLYEWGNLGTSGAVLYIAPKSGFVYRPYNDSSDDLIARFDFGTVEEKDGKISLRPERKIFGVDDVFHSLTWGERSILLPERDAVTLSNFVNAGCPERSLTERVGNAYFPTKRSGLRGKLIGKPVVSRDLEEKVLLKEVTVKVTKVKGRTLYDWAKDRHFRSTDVAIDHGTSSGLSIGMFFYALQPGGDSYVMLKITGITKTEASGEAQELYEGKEPAPLPVGFEFSSQLKAKIFNEPFVPDCW